MTKMKNSCNKKSVKVILCFFIVAILMLGCVMPISASAASDTSLPDTAFITIGDLVELCETTNGGKGLLSTGGDSDVKLRLNFGVRPESLQYDYDSETEKTANAGPMTWLVAGSDADFDTNENSEGSIVLYSEEPLGVGAFNSFPNEFYCGSDMVSAGHWGASALRSYANSLYTDTNYFSAKEKASMSLSQIETYDYRNNKGCTTEDALYAPSKDPSVRGGQIAVGAEDCLLIDSAYLSGMHWLRTAMDYDDERVMTAIPNSSSVSSSIAMDNSKSRSFAFRLELAHVLFASSASSTTVSNDTPTKVSADTPMTLRLDSDDSPLFFSSLNVQNGNVRYRNAPTNARLMALFTTSGGTMYQYSKPVSGDGQLALASIFDSLGGTRFTGKVWLECDMADGGTLTYATVPEDIHYLAWGTPVTRGDGVVQYVDAVGNTSVELALGNLSSDGMLWIEESADGKKTLFGMDLSQGAFALDQGMRACARIITEADSDYAQRYAQLDAAEKTKMEGNKGILFYFDVIDKDGNKLQPSSPVNLYVQMDGDWDSADIKALGISAEDDEALSTECVTKESGGSTDRFAVLTLNHISSSYFAFDELTEADIPAQTPPNPDGGEHNGEVGSGGGSDSSADTGGEADATDKATDSTDPAGENASNGNKGLTTIIVIVSATAVAAVIGCVVVLCAKKRKKMNGQD